MYKKWIFWILIHNLILHTKMNSKQTEDINLKLMSWIYTELSKHSKIRQTTQMKMTWTDTSIKKIDGWKWSTWKDAWHHRSLGKSKFKTTRYHVPIRMTKIFKNLTVLSLGKDVVQVETSEVADGDARWHNHFGEQFGKFLERQMCTYPMIQPCHSYIFIHPGKWKYMFLPRLVHRHL